MRMDECETAFQNLKEYLAKPPLLSLSIQGEDLFSYLAISQTVVSSALICKENKIQWPVYYTSQAFQGAEMKYPRIKKLAFALVVASKRIHTFKLMPSL